jgi:hypothetical protein
MSRKDLKYIFLLTALFVLYILVEIFSPQPANWTVTYDEDHKIPYGTYVLNELMPDLFEGQSIQNSNATLYDLKNSDNDFENLLIICNSFSLDREDEDALVEMLEKGKHVFIAAGWFYGTLFDSLNISVSHSLVKDFAGVRDTSLIYMSDGSSFDEEGPFKYLSSHASLFFYAYDSLKADIIATDHEKDPVLIRYQIGEGSLILCTLPMAFTNYYMLRDRNEYFASNALSQLPVGKVHRTNFYQYGRLEPMSKLRFVLTQPPLAWAYYLMVSAILIYLLFESKRRQRAIPVVAPPKNSTLDFIGTMGNLYFNKGNNKNIAIKKITYFLDHLRQRYFLKTDKLDDDFERKLAMKTNKSPEKTKELLNLIKIVEQKKMLSDQELIELNDKIEDYYFNQ